MHNKRPRYEQQHHLNTEEAALRIVDAAYSHLRRIKLKDEDILDAAYHDDQGRVHLFAEVKGRKRTPSWKYETYFVSLHKWVAMQEMATTTGVPVLFIYSFKDKDRYMLVTGREKPLYVDSSGRGKQRDWQDREPMAHLAREWFTDDPTHPSTAPTEVLTVPPTPDVD